MRLRGTLRHLPAFALLCLLAVLAHQFTLWALPRWIMDRTVQAIAGEPGTAPWRPPLTDHTQRRVVMPSPDLLYTTCAWDVSRQPMRVQARLDGLPYASVALYAANSDNFWVASGGDGGTQVLDLWIRSPHASVSLAHPPAGTQVVVAPSDTGLLLMRVLVGDVGRDLARAEALRQTLRCERSD